MKKSFYFFCVIEGDLLIFSAVSVLLKRQVKNVECLLILPNHPRVQDNIIKKYNKYFDDIIRLPNAVASKNLYQGLKLGKKFLHELRKIKFSLNAYVLTFDIYKLPEIIFYTYIHKIKNKINLKIINISPYLCNQFKKERAKLLIKETLIASFYSIIFGRHKITKRYKIRNTDLKGFLKYTQYVDFQININKSKHRTISKKIFNQTVYPVPILKFKENYKRPKENKPSILLLVSTLHGDLNKEYWEKLRRVLNSLMRYADDFNILIKDHPGVHSKFNDYFNEDFKYFVLDPKISAEVFYLDPILQVQHVFGYGSTALLTASWIGIQCYDYTKLLNFNDSLIDYYVDFLKLGNNIIELDESVIYNIRLESKRDISQLQKSIESSWQNVFKQIGLFDE